MDQDSNKNTYHDKEREERTKSFTRRRLLQVGWTIPVIVALEMSRPKTVLAQGGSHTDYIDYSDENPHDDVPHTDFHWDWDHTDAHNDWHVNWHGDTHNDARHQDWHVNWHGDESAAPLQMRNSSPDEFHGDLHKDIPAKDVTSHDDHLDHIDS